MAIEWEKEWSLIRKAALLRGVDPFFVAAIRAAENGAPGREFGVLSTIAPTYEDQLRITCNSVRNSVERFQKTHGAPVAVIACRLTYTPLFVEVFGNRWAPPSAHDLNKNWITNVTRFYHMFIADGAPGGLAE